MTLDFYRTPPFRNITQTFINQLGILAQRDWTDPLVIQKILDHYNQAWISLLESQEDQEDPTLAQAASSFSIKLWRNNL